VRGLGYAIWIRFWKSHRLKMPLVSYWWARYYPIEDEV